MKDDPTILGDRETVELLSAQPELLAIADAVRATQRTEGRAWALRPRLLVAAAAVAGLAAVCAVVLTGTSGGEPRAVGADHPARLLVHLPYVLRVPDRAGAYCPARSCGFAYSGFEPDKKLAYYPMSDLFDYAITRADAAISSIAVTVRGARVDSTALLEVHMEGGAPPGTRRVVFSERMSLNPITYPPNGQTALLQPLSEWSGTLSPSDWDGGCQDARYWLTLRIRNTDTWTTEIGPTPSFNCLRAALGPTGRVGPTG